MVKYKHVKVYVFMYDYMHACMYVYIYVCMYVSTYVCMYQYRYDLSFTYWTYQISKIYLFLFKNIDYNELF